MMKKPSHLRRASGSMSLNVGAPSSNKAASPRDKDKATASPRDKDKATVSEKVNTTENEKSSAVTNVAPPIAAAAAASATTGDKLVEPQVTPRRSSNITLNASSLLSPTSSFGSPPSSFHTQPRTGRGSSVIDLAISFDQRDAEARFSLVSESISKITKQEIVNVRTMKKMPFVIRGVLETMAVTLDALLEKDNATATNGVGKEAEKGGDGATAPGNNQQLLKKAQAYIAKPSFLALLAKAVTLSRPSSSTSFRFH